MKQKDKELLLKDLCARLPYGVKIHGVFLNYNKDKDKILYEECDEELNYGHLKRYESLKPYLRPLSSMTEEELYEVQEILGKGVEVRDEFIVSVDSSIDSFTYLELIAVFDWLNKNMFDYRGLIRMGLALEAPEGMYN